MDLSHLLFPGLLAAAFSMSSLAFMIPGGGIHGLFDTSVVTQGVLVFFAVVLATYLWPANNMKSTNGV